jgi:hypothetical protein
MDSSTYRLLRNALAEFFVDRYEVEQWTQLGLRIDALDEIQNHGRLLRSLSFGDDDYPVAAADITPKIMSKLGIEDASTLDPWGGPPVDDLDYFADTFPELMAHFRSANPRMWKRVVAQLPSVPKAWVAGVNEEQEAPSGHGEQRASVLSTVGTTHASLLTESKLPEASPDSAPLSFSTLGPDPLGDQIFIAHGRDHGTRDTIRLYVQQITGVRPTVLDGEVNGGQTLIEKFERHAKASSIAIVLLTPDDQGALVGDAVLEPRARQNVIFELGYFIGRLGRQKVIAVNAGVETPSDIAGVLYVPYEGNWKELLRGELRATGVQILD